MLRVRIVPPIPTASELTNRARVQLADLEAGSWAATDLVALLPPSVAKDFPERRIRAQLRMRRWLSWLPFDERALRDELELGVEYALAILPDICAGDPDYHLTLDGAAALALCSALAQSESRSPV
jgi:hypothetical protein